MKRRYDGSSGRKEERRGRELKKMRNVTKEKVEIEGKEMKEKQ